MKTICVTIPWFYPAIKAGGPVQSVLNLVAIDMESDYRIVCSGKDLGGELLAVQKDTWVTFQDNVKVWYASKHIYTPLLEMPHDCIFYANGLYSWLFTLMPVYYAARRRTIVAVRGMLHPGALNQKKIKKWLFLQGWKLMKLHNRVEFHATDDEEKKHIQKVFGQHIRVHVAANVPRVFLKQPVKEKSTGVLNLVSVALVSPMKNILLVLEALKKVPAIINYDIYGPIKDERYWKQCLNLISKLPGNIQVQYHGDLNPMQVENVLQSAHVFILPSSSENFGHAHYEALSAGKPLITSHHTPWKELRKKKAGWNVCLETETELVEAIRYFAELDTRELEDWSLNAKAYSASAIDLEAIKNQYRQMFHVQQPIE